MDLRKIIGAAFGKDAKYRYKLVAYNKASNENNHQHIIHNQVIVLPNEPDQIHAHKTHFMKSINDQVIDQQKSSGVEWTHTAELHAKSPEGAVHGTLRSVNPATGMQIDFKHHFERLA